MYSQCLPKESHMVSFTLLRIGLSQCMHVYASTVITFVFLPVMFTLSQPLPPTDVFVPLLLQQHTAPIHGYTNGQFHGGFPPPPPQMPHYAGVMSNPRFPPQETVQTQTIRNKVNLRKQTVRVDPVSGREGVYSLTFNFDAASPCRASVFVHVAEDPERSCALRPIQPRASWPPRYYNKGMDLSFADESSADDSSLLIDTREVGVAQLTSQQGDTYPLVVRLETVTEEGKQQGLSLESLPPGSPLPQWVQAQTTYMKLCKEASGRLSAMVLKQKIWFSGHSYELQEIYGIEQNRWVDGRRMRCVHCACCRGYICA